MISLIDIPATFMAAGGMVIPDHFKGRSLQELAAGKAVDWPEDVFIQISESQVGRAVRTKKWCYSVTAPNRQGGTDSASDVYVEEFLYDQETDPHERNNLVTNSVYEDQRAVLKEILLRRMKEAGEEVPEIKPAVSEIG
jgi:arylsulfatase A-like enzyme